ncbi:MAG TPA: hypothetical protein VGF29_06800 [Hyphomicrobiaceae bacterium]
MRLRLRRRSRADRAGVVPSLHWSDARFAIAAVLAALPCGYGSGVVAAYLLSGGPDIGRAPLLTVPLALLVTTVFGLLPFLQAETRFMIASVGAIAAAVLFLMVRLAFP